MQKYCNIIQNELNMLIRNIEKNVSDFVIDPKRESVRKSELSFSKTMRFFHGYRHYAVDDSDIHIPNIPNDHGTHHCANNFLRAII